MQEYAKHIARWMLERKKPANGRSKSSVANNDSAEQRRESDDAAAVRAYARGIDGFHSDVIKL